MMKSNTSLLQHLRHVTGKPLNNATLKPLYGGGINRSYHLKTDEFSWFIKLNDFQLEAMFAAEAAGLKELAQTHTVKVPQVIVHGNDGQQAYLILEYLSLVSSCHAQAQRCLGQQLAQLHRKKQPYYGWSINNTIGKTPQHNPASQHWGTFWQQQRLAKQLHFTAEKGYTGQLQTQGEKLCAEVGHFFSTYQPQPSLVHGDLWAGNKTMTSDGSPVIFDPACYYADREVDIAMSELFGGFGDDFYAAYQNEWALDDGYPIRKTLYNLYHSLNHLNLFGESYAQQTLNMISKLLAEL